MPKTGHTIIKEKDNTYSLNCAVVDRTWPFNPPIQRVVMICPICNETRLDINPIENGMWLITEEK